MAHLLMSNKQLSRMDSPLPSRALSPQSTQQRLDTTEELFHEAREAAARHEQRAIESERSVSRLQDRVSLLEASARGRERALESIPPELQSPEESASWRTPPSSTPQRSPLKVSTPSTCASVPMLEWNGAVGR